MFTTFFYISLLLALVGNVFAQFTVDTPQLVQCQAVQLTWTETNSPPYDILVVPADDMCGDPIESICSLTGSSTTWTPNLAAGTQVVLVIEDQAGNDAWSGFITVGNSSDTSCLTSPTGTPSTTPSATPSATSTPAISVTPPSSTGNPNPSASPSSTSSIYAPAGAANAGLSPTSGALSTRPLSAVALFGSTVLAAVAFVL